jgi:hypothetical protein
MRRLTTPEHTFELDIDVDIIEKIYIDYAQSGKILVEKTIEDVTFNENCAIIEMTQEETKKFDAKIPIVDFQIRIIDKARHSIASDILHLSLEDVLNDEVL